MPEEWKISFIKSKQHLNFHLNSVIGYQHKGMITIDLVEEGKPQLKDIIFENGEVTTVNFGETNVINNIHASAVIHPDNLKTVIESLTTIYNNYLNNPTG